MKITSAELAELNLRRSQEDLKDLINALLEDGEIVVSDPKKAAKKK